MSAVTYCTVVYCHTSSIIRGQMGQMRKQLKKPKRIDFLIKVCKCQG